MKSFRLLALLASIPVCFARHEPVVCGYHGDNWREELQLHKQAQKHLKKRSRAATINSLQADNGNIAVMDEADGVVSRRNSFDMNKKGIRFVPLTATASKYKYEPADANYDSGAASAGTLLQSLGDDDTREVAIPFTFPFFGKTYNKLFVNSDGNLTFDSGDAASLDRSLGRMISGAPRISPLFADLDPTNTAKGVYALSEAGRLVISWVSVPEFSDFNDGFEQTFQVRLYPDGRVEFAYDAVTIEEAVTGMTPGGATGTPSLVDFTAAVAEEYTSTIAERFSGADAVDIFAGAQKFYLNHDDAYDYVVIYNTLGVQAGDGVVAYEVTTRNDRSGYGDTKIDIGAEAGSRRRLQAVLNMGPLSQYPKDPNAVVAARRTARDTVMTVLGHEAGHLFLAFASVRNPDNPSDYPMLGRSLVHWNFAFNSEASLLEGNRIRDNGETANPRFTTTATVEGYAPLDQYLMGFIPPTQVPDTFYVKNPTTGAGGRSPQTGVNFNGQRMNVSVSDLIREVGRRTPDYTVAQRHFRFAFVLVTAANTPATADEIAQLDTYRREFESAFSRFTGNNATADTRLLKAVQLSSAPASGVLTGATGTGTVEIDKASDVATVFTLQSTTGSVTVPANVTIPAGSTKATFNITGARAGVDEVVAVPANTAYETAYSKIQVASGSDLHVTVVSGDNQGGAPGVPLPSPVVFKVVDANELPYSGVRLDVTLTGGGSVDRTSVTTDAQGLASLRWTPGTGEVNELRVRTESGATASATVKARPAFASGAVVNAASFVPGITPGGIATIFGSNVSGATVKVNGSPTQVFYSDAHQVNFLVPTSAASPTANVVVENAGGTSETVSVPVNANSPGVFFDAGSGYGAILISGTASVTQVRPAAAGDFIEIYGTGFNSGPVQVTIAGQQVEVPYAGQAPSFPGLFQVNAKIPSGLPSGPQSLVVTQAGVASNQVKVQLR